eukprot:m.123698 g.123698  ORF g.123698 m.123698 type:complete len:349 (-) comp15684_c0_seq5:791-1837(-)
MDALSLAGYDGHRRRSARATRSRSAIDSRDITEALRRRRLTKAEKRGRNQTLVGPIATTEVTSAEPSPNWLREAEMRQEIMKLQKIHIKELQREARSLKEENKLLIQSLAARDQELGQAQLECEMLTRDLEEVENSHQGQLNVGTTLEDHIADVESERNEALRKLSNVLSLVEALSKGNSLKTSQGALRAAFEQPNTETRFAAFEQLAQRICQAEQHVQQEVTQSNKFLSAYLERDVQRLEAVPRDDSALEQLMQLRARLRPKMRTLVQSSNSLVVRSAAASPAGKQKQHFDCMRAPTCRTASLNASLTASLPTPFQRERLTASLPPPTMNLSYSHGDVPTSACRDAD